MFKCCIEGHGLERTVGDSQTTGLDDLGHLQP